MSRAEYIIWRAESREQIEREHPTWNLEQVTGYLDAVEAILERKGLLVKEFEEVQA